jgi:hypothetical protein
MGLLRKVIIEVIRTGMPVGTAIGGAMIASQKKKNLPMTVAYSVAGWGAGYVTQLLALRFLEGGGATLPDKAVTPQMQSSSPQPAQETLNQVTTPAPMPEPEPIAQEPMAGYQVHEVPTTEGTEKNVSVMGTFNADAFGTNPKGSTN